ncbi:MAG: aldehyde dehydrogenase family protein, partial [Nitrospinae bacterium]|nr:aldehyde dehydrogenase family protein [Nitrospinota bacterium]
MHLPILRAGQPYTSLDRLTVAHIATGQPLAQVSQANRGLIARDLAAQERNRQALQALTVAELVSICQRAADLFLHAELPLGDDGQTPDDYVAQVSATTGLPQSLARANMDKIHRVGIEMPAVLSGLTRGLDLTVLDDGPSPLHFSSHAQALGCILPSNSPGVHALWLPAIPLKTPLVLKPGREEPWTPYRIAQSLIAAGCPPQALSYYPTDHGGSTEILLRCGRSLLFGGGPTVAPWRDDSRIQLHGPGRSKIIIGADKIDQWEDYLDLMVASIASNGGRSCLNASGIWVPAHGHAIAAALGERLSQIQARPFDDPQAQIAAFSNPAVAHQISALIDGQLGDAVDTARDQGERVADIGGCTFLNPTLIHAPDWQHPLANTEYLFPFASVVEVPQEEMVARIGPTL